MHIVKSGGARARLALLIGTAVGLAAPSLAYGQDAASAQVAAVEEVIVTAQRREERLQDVPAAVSAYTGNQLERLGIEGSKELSQVTPGLNFTQSVFSPQPTIRGIGVRGVGAGDESVVPVYIDGVYVSFIAASDLQFNNIERIEVLKGPQGALLGRNATGGAINVITKTPREGFEGRASVSYGSFDEIIGKAYVSGGTDTIAGDLAFYGVKDDGYIDDPLRNDTYGAVENYSVRSKLVVRPTDVVELRLSAGYTNNVESTGEAYRLPNGNTVGARVPGNTVTTRAFDSTLSYHPYNKLRSATASVTGIFRLEPFTITSVTGFADNKLRIKADSDGTPLEIATLTYVQVSDNIYQEVYATSNNDGPFSWIAGAVYFRDTSGMSPQSTTYSRPVSLAGVVGNQAISVTRPRIDTDAFALYMQGSLKLGEAWTVTLGGRYSHETKKYRSRVGATTITTLSGEKTFEDFSPTAVIQYQPDPRLNLYAKAGRAFKSGVFNASASNPAAAVPVDPEKVTQYEVGVKSDPTRWLRLNAAAYYTDYNGLQSNVRDPVTLSSALQNAGGADIYGLEGEAFVRASDNLNVRLGLSWIKGEYKDFPSSLVYLPQTAVNPPASTPCVLGSGALAGGNRSAFCNVSGNDIIRTPFLTANVGFDYTLDTEAGEIVFTGNAYYKGKSYWDTLNYFKEDAIWLVNGDITWNLPGDRISLSVWGENLLDETYSLTRVISPSGETQVLAKPRTTGVKVSYAW
ncbi:TonB-dependent receptor [Phenylobacterium zucineum HLK1]|uniref:TonB-dependent receptor n=1 Tax=Phenylobacterium zucineum (strain HLK1) TaxID=450851 RepID=B4RGM3_PHEZH|nr:TonB-dependent receptor [Phenylobacterium zucineum]ACG78929.1 TonB-dependent receptor [Phenylobacterium zucineum HLK1]